MVYPVDKIFNFIESFSLAEVKASSLHRKPALEPYNKAIDELNFFLTGMTNIGHKKKNQPESEDYYEDYKDFPDDKPRHIFKISHYTHNKFSNVWVVYVSRTNPQRKKILSEALFVVEEDNDLKIGRRYSYSNHGSGGENFHWEAREGLSDLTFESLEELLSVEKYQEPADISDSLKLYKEEK